MSEEQQAQPAPQPQQAVPGVPPQQAAPAGPPQAPAQGYGYPPQAPAQGYGYPPQDPQSGVPPQGYPAAPVPGYGYPPPGQEGYVPGAFPPPGQQPPPQVGRYGPGTFQNDAEAPDWTALADQHENESRRKRRTMLVVGGLVAALAVGGIVTAAVLLKGGDKPTDTPTATAKPSAAKSSAAAAPKPTTPEEALSRSTVDKAPLSVDALLPDAKLTVGDQVLSKVATEKVSSCSTATNNGLGAVLGAEECQEVYLATYLSDKAAVTVGIAVFDTKPQADRVQSKVVGNIKALRTNATPRFCPDLKQCTFSNAAFGRYVVFTTAGNADTTAVTDANPVAKVSAAGLAKQALDNLTARGNAVLQNAS